MSEAEEDPPLLSSATDEAPNKPNKPSSGSSLGTRHSLAPSHRPSRDEEDVTQQLVELRALNEKHAQIISLLQERFNTPVDISEIASRLLRNLDDGWRRIDETPCPVRDSAEGLLRQMIPCETHFMGLHELRWSQEGSVETDEDVIDMLQIRLRHVESVFKTGDGVFGLELVFSRSPAEQALWRPVYLNNGKRTRDREKCVWPSNWDFLLARKFRSQRPWSFFSVVPSGCYGDDFFNLERILLSTDEKVHCAALSFVNS